MLTAAFKFPRNLALNANFEEKIDGEMSLRTIPTSLLQIFFLIILNTEVISKSGMDAYDNFHRNT